MRRLAAIVALLALLLAGVAALAQPGGYDLTWGAVGGGGGSASGGAYELGGTAGQAGAGTLSGGPYSLSGGFWGLASGLLGPYVGQYKIYLPLTVKGASGW